MLYRSIICIPVTALSLALASSFVAPAPGAQEKQKREEFGSSLKRLRWDEREQRTVETKQDDERSDSGVVIRVETSLAVFEVLALDKEGRAVSGLSKNDFIITEDGTPQEVAGLSSSDSSTVPRSIVMIIDYSGSQRPFIENSVAAAKTLIDRLRPNDRMAIVTDDIALLVDFTRDKSKLKDGLNSLRKKAKSGRPGRSEQYSALLATLKELIRGVERPIIIFQTDGDELGRLRNAAVLPQSSEVIPSDSFKEYSLEDVYAAAEKTRAAIYAVIPGVRFDGVPPEEHVERARKLFEKLFQSQQEWGGWRRQLTPTFENYLRSRAQMSLRQQQALAGVANLTGGWGEYLEEPGQAAGIYDRILAGIERRYILTFYPTNTKRDGKLRRVEIKVRNHPEYVIRGKKSYYAESR